MSTSSPVQIEEPAPTALQKVDAVRPKTDGPKRVGFLGAGYIADWHAQALAQVRGVRLVAVCDRALPKARLLAGKFGIPSTYASLEEMLAHEQLDAVHVLLPPDLHFEAARALIQAGVHVFLEKPMCTSAVEAEQLIALSHQYGVRLGIGHNFLFSTAYEKLRRDVRAGILGAIDHVTITWHRPLPPVQYGPFNSWMLRNPRNIIFEVGSHSVAHMLDLLGEPDCVAAHPDNPIELPTRATFYRRWQVQASCGRTAVELRFSFVPGFSEYAIHVRGSFASATVDFERGTYILSRHRPLDPDFDAYSMLRASGDSLRKQARQNLFRYFRSKLDLGARGNPYGETITKALDAFYSSENTLLDPRINAHRGAAIISVCEKISNSANLPATAQLFEIPAPSPSDLPLPRVLVLGATGFIGRELVRQLVKSGRTVRVLVRNPGSLPRELQSPRVHCYKGDILNPDDLQKAMSGTDCVVHLARSNVKTWAEYQELEVGGTRQVAECALKAGIKRLVYTGTIASYYQGSPTQVITESTPLDPGIARGNLYARAKTTSENQLLDLWRSSSLPVVILRPGVVIGRGGSPFHWGVAMWWHDAVCQTWGAGRHKLPLVLVEDVARALIAAMDTPGIDGRSFNLVGDPCLSAQEYLDELDRCGGFRVQRHATPIAKFYAIELAKWMAKVALRFPERQFPRYSDWKTRTLMAPYDCSAAKTALGWKPETDRDEFIRKGIAEPLSEVMR